MAIMRDDRGYTGGERNRVLSPEQVRRARESVANRRSTARQWAQAFGMSVDSVRRMLRGETYANVGATTPDERADIDELAEAMQATGLVPARTGPDDGDPEALATFARAVAAQRERNGQSDALAEELEHKE